MAISKVGGRAADLDLLKTLLVWGMIAAHCIQLLAFRPHGGADIFSTFINVISFSGFMFAFGLGVGLSGGSAKSWIDRLRPVVLLLVATWVSEAAFELLVDRQHLTPELAYNIVTLTRLYGWSEFLASFAVLYLIIAIARPILTVIGSRWPLLLVAVAACFASTWWVSNAFAPGAATIIGTNNFASFPLLAYLPWFLVGVAFGRERARPWLIDWGLALIGTAAFAWFVWRNGGELPGRFPPTVWWIVGPALPLLIYLAVSRGVASAVPTALLAPGRHVLASLLVSNLAIFSLRWWFGYRLGAWWWTPLLALALIVAVTIWSLLLDRTKALGAVR